MTKPTPKTMLSADAQVSMGIDISARQQAEEALRQAMEQLRIVTDSMAAPVTRCSRDLKYQWVSKPYADWIKRPAAEIVGRPIREIIGPEAFEQLRSHFDQVLAGQPVRYEKQIHFQGIGPRWINAIYTPTRDASGVPDGWVAVVIDIDDRKRLEEALQESETRLAAELEAMTRLHALSTRLLAVEDLRTALDDLLENAIAACGADFGNIQLYNEQHQALEIVAQRGFAQEFLDYFRLVRADEGSACAQAMQSGQPIVIEDVQVNPSYVPHRAIAASAGYRAVMSTPLTDRDSTVIGMLSIHFREPHRPSERDQRLIDLYARHAADLVKRHRTEEALREADRRKDEFLATLAHELRNPLAPIRNGLQIIRLSEDPEALGQARSMMERQLGQMVRLIDDLLDVSRITRGKVELRKERIELAAVVRSAVETCHALVESFGHELHVTLPPEPCHLEADFTRMTQVFCNLLNNAAKYSDRGGHIELIAERDGAEVVVTVKDTGIGIPADMVSKIFNLFTQVHRDEPHSQGGLGIGLTLVKSLVELHGGTIEARSEGADKGSAFVVRLPLLESAVAAQPLPADGKQVPSGSGRVRILVVDDLRDSAESLAMFLRLMGHEVCTAGDGVQAVETALAFQPQVILLDIGLPKIDGYEACRRIRALPFGREMVLVAVTGWGQEEDRRKAKAAGFDHHMVKPVEPAAIEKLLRSLPVGS